MFGKIADFFKPLITDADNLLSIGRTSYWLVFGLTLFLWVAEKSVPDSLVTVLMALMGYEVFKKGRDVVKGYLTKDTESIE